MTSPTPTSLALDKDLFEIISDGVPGTWMPAWKKLLSEEERWSLVEHVKRFSAATGR